VLVDSLPAQDAFGGQVDWAAYPPDNVVRAELLRGAGSALYGSGAVGGVLELQTRAPNTDARLPADGQVSAGGGGLARSDASFFYRTPLGEKLAASLWSSTASASYFVSPDTMRSKVDHPARSQSDATQLRVRTTGGAGTFEGSALFSTDAQDQGRPNYNFGRTFEQGALRYDLAGARTETSLEAYARETRVLNVADQFPAKPGVLRYVQHVPSWEDGVFGSWTSHAPNLVLDLRADLRAVHGISDQRGGDGSLQSMGSGSQTLTGFAVQADWRVARFEALAGARYDRVAFSAGRLVTVSGGKTTIVTAAARDDAAVSPRLALRYDLSPAVALRASSGAGFRAPFLNELVRGFQIGATQFAPNPALIPERARTDGAGVDVLGARSRLAVDLTRTVVNDAIGFVTITPTLQQRANVARTRTDGALATYTESIGRCVRARLSGQTQYARVLAGPPATIGKRLPYVPDRQATLGIDAQAGPVRYGFDASFVGTAYADDINTQLLNRVLLLGARVATPLGNGGTLTLSAENITDRIYLSSIDRLGPPSAITLRATFPLGAGPRTTANAPLCAG
jgi:outer membrane receptor protein involved in Fe transport